MDCVILYRVNGGRVEFVSDAKTDTENIAVFQHMDDAIAYVDANALFQSGMADYQIVELDEL